jgi:hypothetical protein
MLAGFFNKTVIDVGQSMLLVRHGPIPWPGNRRLSTADVTQLYCEEKTSRRRNCDTSTETGRGLIGPQRGAILLDDSPRSTEEVAMRTPPWFAAALVLFVLPSPGSSQPTLASLWPNPDGMRWDYRITASNSPDSSGNFTSDAMLQLSGTAQTAGGTAQVLLAGHGLAPLPAAAGGRDPLLRSIWRARPDLRPAIEARYGKPTDDRIWWPLLLHDGYFMKTAVSLQMWQPDWNHATWTYLHNDLRVGATFTHQLIPELADNVFLHGTVEAVDASVATLVGTFEHAVRMRYVIDYGWADRVDESGRWIGRFRGETRGHVHFVPDLGPVEMLEDFLPYVEVDCGMNDCPPEWTAHLGESVQTLTLSLTRTPVSVVQASWSRVKALYE